MPIKQWSADQWDAIKGDGCTGIPDLWMESPCERHDRHYETHVHRDGTPVTRYEADVELMKDAWKSFSVMPSNGNVFMAPVRAVAKVTVPVIVFLGVRLFGRSHW